MTNRSSFLFAAVCLVAAAGCAGGGAPEDSAAGGAGGGAGRGGATAPTGAAGGAVAAGSAGAIGTAGAAAGSTGGTAGATGTAGAAGAADATGGRAGGVAGNAGTGGRGGAAIAGRGGGAAGATAGRGGGTGAVGGSGGAGEASGLIAAPDGVESAPGTLSQPTTLTAALGRVAPGQTIYLRGGVYVYAAQVTIDRSNSGTAAKPKTVLPYMSEKPVLDFSSQPYGTSSNPRGLQVNGSYWHIKGLEAKGSADNGIYVAGNHNVIESCVVHGNRDTGLQIGRASSSDQMPDWPTDNLIVNCESYDNYDAPPGGGENADGFAAKLTVGAGNTFRGCVSRNNIDDGWDLYTKTDTGAIGPVTIDQCVAHHNGKLTDGTSSDSGDRNGFKLGGDDIAVAHVVTRSVAFANGKNGFTWNSNPGAIRLANNLAFDNAEGNFKFGDNSTPTQAVFTNNVSFWTTSSSAQSDKAIGTDVAMTNCWWDKSKSQPSINGKGLVVTAADFAVSLTNPTVTRAADGSVVLTIFRLAAGSDLANAGSVPAGTLPFDAAGYYQGAPDLGAVETQ
jgi:hypothetical protein